MIFQKNKNLLQQDETVQIENEMSDEINLNAHDEGEKVEEPVLEMEETAKNSLDEKAEETSDNNTLAYKFSVPNPMPKDLTAVLKEMLKKLFPSVLKAYLVKADYGDKTGYLLVVDADAKFLKIINLYLDGKTKKVRGDVPIACVLYSRSGNLTDGMAPFYRKEGTEPATILSLSDFAVRETASGFLLEELFKVDEKTNGETNEEATDEAIQVKEEPITKEHLFEIMTIIEKENLENIDTQKEEFSAFEFFIPYTADSLEGVSYEEVLEEIPEGINPIYLVNRENGIKAVVFFTDAQNALSFAKQYGAVVVKMSYNGYKDAISASLLPPPSAEGIIINPDLEQILLPPDYPLL